VSCEMRDAIRVYTQPAFLICAAVLATAGGGMSFAIKSFGMYLKKEPLPLKKPLDFLDESDLSPYRVVSKEKIKNEDVVRSLGTEDYIQCVLEDSDVTADKPVHLCSLFITYYDLPDVVLHVPEECYMGVGFQRLASDSVVFKVNKDDLEQEIPGRYLVFASTASDHWGEGAKFPVLYFLKANNDYTNSREAARIALNKNIRGRYSYFSKVEWKFYNEKFGTVIYPSEEEAITASRKLLGVILPVLEREYWPDWQKQ
jgi:hypothetical protein